MVVAPPDCRSFAHCSAASPSMSTTATRQPCRARRPQIAAPMPAPPPVTTATAHAATTSGPRTPVRHADREPGLQSAPGCSCGATSDGGGSVQACSRPAKIPLSSRRPRGPPTEKPPTEKPPTEAADREGRASSDRRRRARPLGRRVVRGQPGDGGAVRRPLPRDPAARARPGRRAADPRDRQGDRRGGDRRAGPHLRARALPDGTRRVPPRRRILHRQHRVDGQRRVRARALLRRRGRVGRVPPRARAPVPGRPRRLRSGDPLGPRQHRALRRAREPRRDRRRERRRQPRDGGGPPAPRQHRPTAGRAGAHLSRHRQRVGDPPVARRVRRHRHHDEAGERVPPGLPRRAGSRPGSVRVTAASGEPGRLAARPRRARRLRPAARRRARRTRAGCSTKAWPWRSSAARASRTAS